MYSINHFINRNAYMPIVAQVLIALVCLIHVYIFLLETVLYKSRGVKVFGKTTWPFSTHSTVLVSVPS